MTFKIIPHGQTVGKDIGDLTEREAKDALHYITKQMAAMIDNPLRRFFDRFRRSKGVTA